MSQELAGQRPLTGRVPEGAIRRRCIARLEPGLIERARSLPDLTANLSDAMDNLGVRGVVPATELACQIAGKRIVGQAVTVRNVPLPLDASTSAKIGKGYMGEHEAYNLADPGDVVVIEGVNGVSNLGGQSAMVALRSGCAGAVIDGSFRDPDTSKQLGFPIWSRGPSPITGKWRLKTVEINGVVQIAGVCVDAGDLVAADDAGVVFVPFDHVHQVIVEAERIALGDARQQLDIRGGISLAELASSKYK